MRALVKIWSLTVLYTLSAHCFAQTTYQLKGAVKEASNTTIPNAIIQYDSYVIHTDIDGAFEINFNGKLYLKISAIGFETFYDTLNIQADVTLIFSMKKISREIGQVVIEEEASRFENFKTINKIETTEIKQTPSASGIPDVFSSMKTQPGVQSNTEGQKGLIIRGGNYDQSTTYVDGVPVMGSSHLFGLLSMFQTDCIKDVELYNGYKPVKFGATLGPAIEINLKEKFTQEMQNSGSLSTSVISTQIQSTISDKNLFLQVGFRKSNLFLIQNLIDKAINNNGSRVVSPVYAFGDVTIKASYLFKNQKLEILHIRSSDEVNYDVEFVATERKYENSMSW
ncbi:MAG: TonB-dependent receptor plug domain-containing protein, partial [Flavobacteriales bacterium]